MWTHILKKQRILHFPDYKLIMIFHLWSCPAENIYVCPENRALFISGSDNHKKKKKISIFGLANKGCLVNAGCLVWYNKVQYIIHIYVWRGTIMTTMVPQAIRMYIPSILHCSSLHSCIVREVREVCQGGELCRSTTGSEYTVVRMIWNVWRYRVVGQHWVQEAEASSASTDFLQCQRQGPETPASEKCWRAHTRIVTFNTSIVGHWMTKMREMGYFCKQSCCIYLHCNISKISRF